MIVGTDLPQRRSVPPVARPDGFAPPYDSFEPRFKPGNDHVMFVLFGIENRGGDDSIIVARLLATFSGDHVPAILEHGRVRAGYGPQAKLWFAYWRSQSAYDLWLARSDVAALWDDDSLLTGPIGVWREAGAINHDYNETSFSEPEGITGLSNLSDGIGITDIHAYWGSARDRIVAAADSPLSSEGTTLSVTGDGYGRRIRVIAPTNACLIRTSQDVVSTTEEQRAIYFDSVEPTLLAGVDYLRSNGREAGCFGLRFIEEYDADGEFRGRTCGVGYFNSLASLERWTHTHPTHEAIMGSFMGMVQLFQGQPGLRLWHEVTVFPTGALTCEYLNCSRDGSLISLATA